ncbi:MAG: hypothetical protein ABI633_07615, partial [Burkholderiales bacterium]
VSAARLLKAPPSTPLGALRQPIVKLPALMPVTTAVEEPALARDPLAAVVEHGGRLLGSVTLAELRDAAAATVQRPVDGAQGAAGFVASAYWLAVSALIQALLGALMPDARGRR